jgi:hypothetical protein
MTPSTLTTFMLILSSPLVAGGGSAMAQALAAAAHTISEPKAHV